MIKVEREDQGAKGRFVLYADEAIAGEMTYTRAGDKRIIIDHTEVNPAYAGKGFGKKMVLAAVDYARAEAIRILPLCPFAKKTFERDPSLQDALE